MTASDLICRVCLGCIRVILKNPLDNVGQLEVRWQSRQLLASLQHSVSARIVSTFRQQPREQLFC